MDSSLIPPPPYHELDRKHSSPNLNQHQIPRRPVNATLVRPQTSNGPSSSSAWSSGEWKEERSGQLDVQEVRPSLPPRPGLILEISPSIIIADSQLYLTPQSARTSRSTTPISPVPNTSSSYFPPTDSIPTPTSSQSPSAYLQSAYREARHFAGGLISHPSESSKHYSILRHSHGLVFYQGPDTTLSVSIFADRPLPLDRTLWLQSKGWSGKTGMRIRAFMGRDGNWLNVTPAIQVVAEQLKPTDERAWQRDIASFRKKSRKKKWRDHTLRETAIVRIPAEAMDGYFQLVLCMGDKKKVLCPSPVFRILSSSISPSSIKGASLSTLPLELGAMAFETYLRNTAGRVVGPATMVVQNRVKKYMPSKRVQKVATTAFDVVRAESKNGTIDCTPYGNSFNAQLGDFEIAIEQGPLAPYPLHFTARTQLARTESNLLGMPALTLESVSSDHMRRLDGYYFGWCRVLPKSKQSVSPAEETWYQIITSNLLPDATQLFRANHAEASQRVITMRFIQDSDPEDLPSPPTTVEIRLLGFIRPDDPSQRAILHQGLQAGDEAAVEAAMLTDFDDISFTQSFLFHEAWGPDAGERERLTVVEKMRKGLVEGRRRVEGVPLHKLGLRMPGNPSGNGVIVGGGFYVVR